MRAETPEERHTLDEPLRGARHGHQPRRHELGNEAAPKGADDSRAGRLQPGDDLAQGHEPLVAPRPGMWDSGRVGASCVPFRTPAGWLLIYHGADETHRYCVGVALVDGADPSKVLARSREPIMTPGASYEEHGFFGGVVFPTGAVVRDDGGVTVYYGAADQHVCAAETTLDELLGCLADA